MVKWWWPAALCDSIVRQTDSSPHFQNNHNSFPKWSQFWIVQLRTTAPNWPLFTVWFSCPTFLLSKSTRMQKLYCVSHLQMPRFKISAGHQQCHFVTGKLWGFNARDEVGVDAILCNLLCVPYEFKFTPVRMMGRLCAVSHLAQALLQSSPI